MVKFLKATGIYALAWLVFFIAARLVFLLVQFKELIRYPLPDIVQTFLHGYKMDVSVTAYIILLPLIAVVPWFFTGGNWYIKALKIYTSILIVIITSLVLGDAIVYTFWGYRVDFSVVGYLSNPKDAMASATTLQLIGGFAADALIIYLLIKTFNMLIDKIYVSPKKKKIPVIETTLVVVLTGLMIIPIRGGLGIATLNPGSAYFSNHLFLNHSALNVTWYFGHTAMYKKPAENPYQFTSSEEAQNNFRTLMNDDGNTVKVLKTDRPNILLIIMESFGTEMITSPEENHSVAPRFNEYIPTGIYFSNLYAAGSRTDKAIPSILSGYPNLPTIQIIREPRKTQKIPGIFRMLDSVGYKTSFWYGGDLNFAHLSSYIGSAGFREKITMENFDRKDRNSKWGIHDHVVFERLFDSLQVTREPFAYAMLSLSSHEPFEVPMEPVFKGTNILSRFKNSIHYADKSLGEFLDKAKMTNWWKRTLVIIIADHCRRNSITIPTYSESIFRIPMLWLGGALAVSDTVINKPASQFDLCATLSSQINLNKPFHFSKNILSTGSAPFAFYTYNEGFAFITDSAKAIYDIKLKDCLEKEGNHKVAEKYGKSFLQVLFDDYLSR